MTRQQEKAEYGYNTVYESGEWERKASDARSSSGYKRNEAIHGAANALGAGLKLVDTGEWNKKHKRNAHAEVAEGSAEKKLWEHGGAAADAGYLRANAGTYCNGLTGG